MLVRHEYFFEECEEEETMHDDLCRCRGCKPPLGAVREPRDVSVASLYLTLVAIVLGAGALMAVL